MFETVLSSICWIPRGDLKQSNQWFDSSTPIDVVPLASNAEPPFLKSLNVDTFLQSFLKFFK